MPQTVAFPPNTPPTRPTTAAIRIGLLGLGVIGSAVAELTRTRRDDLPARLAVTSALVRDPAHRPRPIGVPVTSDPGDLFATRPDVVVEVLGGLEPARTLVLEAIARGIPVVTANKSLLAHHGDELLEAAARARVPFCYEASVIAGVPFLSTLARRPLASSIVSLTGIVNGTTNYILTRIADTGADYRAALAEAQQHGFAEPDPSKDVNGIDAQEKLVVLLRQLAGCRIVPGDIDAGGIVGVSATDLAHARDLGGTIKPVVHAEWSNGHLSTFAGPAFVPSNHPLAGIRGATNGICLIDRAGSALFMSGPGAGPAPTAVTILDDVIEAAAGARTVRRPPAAMTIAAPETGWFVRATIAEGSLLAGCDLAGRLAAHGVRTLRTTALVTDENRQAGWFLTAPCSKHRIQSAVDGLQAGATATFLRAVDAVS